MDITPTLQAWLMPHRKFTGPIFPTGRPEGVGGRAAKPAEMTLMKPAKKPGSRNGTKTPSGIVSVLIISQTPTI